MTKAAEFRRWLAHKIWGGNGCYGWTAIGDQTKRERAVIDRWLKDQHVEQDQYGLIRLTTEGRKALDLPPASD